MNRNGRRSWGSGQLLGQPGELLGLERGPVGAGSAAAAASAVGLAGAQRGAGRLGGRRRVGVEARRRSS